MAVVETWGLVGTEESPLAIGFDSLHEEIRDPESIEQVSCSILLLSMILP